jgi:hypothetical protein
MNDPDKLIPVIERAADRCNDDMPQLDGSDRPDHDPDGDDPPDDAEHEHPRIVRSRRLVDSKEIG